MFLKIISQVKSEVLSNSALWRPMRDGSCQMSRDRTYMSRRVNQLEKGELVPMKQESSKNCRFTSTSDTF